MTRHFPLLHRQLFQHNLCLDTDCRLLVIKQEYSLPSAVRPRVQYLTIHYSLTSLLVIWSIIHFGAKANKNRKVLPIRQLWTVNRLGLGKDHISEGAPAGQLFGGDWCFPTGGVMVFHRSEPTAGWAGQVDFFIDHQTRHPLALMASANVEFFLLVESRRWHSWQDCWVWGWWERPGAGLYRRCIIWSADWRIVCPNRFSEDIFVCDGTSARTLHLSTAKAVVLCGYY